MWSPAGDVARVHVSAVWPACSGAAFPNGFDDACGARARQRAGGEQGAGARRRPAALPPLDRVGRGHAAAPVRRHGRRRRRRRSLRCATSSPARRTTCRPGRSAAARATPCRPTGARSHSRPRSRRRDEAWSTDVDSDTVGDGRRRRAGVLTARHAGRRPEPGLLARRPGDRVRVAAARRVRERPVAPHARRPRHAPGPRAAAALGPERRRVRLPRRRRARHCSSRPSRPGATRSIASRSTRRASPPPRRRSSPGCTTTPRRRCRATGAPWPGSATRPRRRPRCGRPRSRAATPAAGAAARQLTHENDALVARLALHPAEDFWFTGAGGTRVQGFVVKPPHGSREEVPGAAADPRRAAGRVARPVARALELPDARRAGLGALVIVNPRGSTGYGQRFVDAGLAATGAAGRTWTS